MSYYSIAAHSTISLQNQDPLIFIEPGMNAFIVPTDNIEGLLESLRLQGVQILGVNALDEHYNETTTNIVESDIPTEKATKILEHVQKLNRSILKGNDLDTKMAQDKNFVQGVEKGWDDVDHGRVVPLETVKKRLGVE